MMVHAVLVNPFVHGALTGLVGAAIVDVRAFMAWKSVQDSTTFDWRTALLRWLQGAVGGVMLAGGLSLAT